MYKEYTTKRGGGTNQCEAANVCVEHIIRSLSLFFLKKLI